MNEIIDLLAKNPVAAYAVATAIAIVAMMSWWLWTAPALSNLAWNLRTILNGLRTADGDWPRAVGQLARTDSSLGMVADAWDETQRRVVQVPAAGQAKLRLLGSPSDIWSAERLLSRKFNLPLAEAVPNILVGVGLLFTFFFLTLAIGSAAQVINTSGTTAAENTNFINAASGLLSAAGAKFSTSLAGLFASLVWSVKLRKKLAALSLQCDEILRLIEVMVPSTGIEDLMTLQATQANQLVQTAADHADVANELLTELRDQTGTLKRFETDLAVSLAGAITSAFAPQMEQMTDRLTGAINDLSKNLSSINQDALQKMLTEFNTAIKENTATEMTQFREALVKLSDRLDAAGVALGDGVKSAATNVSTAGETLATRVNEVSGTLTTGATNLEAASQSLRESIGQLDAMLDRASEQGEKGTRFLTAVLNTAEGMSGTFATVSAGLAGTASLVEKLAGELTETVSGVEELTGEQRTVINQLRADAPKAIAAINDVTRQLQEAVGATKTAMEETRKSIAAASTSLNSTVDSINTGVSQYSEQVATLHSEMDEQLAKAIGGLGKTTADLAETLEELTESLATVSQRAR
jgi:predicted  nucleic acid-binding Zn-ribbon protein